jgi:hypothetical protein
VNEFEIEWSDLSSERQDSILESLKEYELEKLKDETENGKYGKNFGRKEYQEMTWQEACVREYSHDFMLWETEEEAKTYDWKYGAEELAEENAQARIDIWRGIFIEL